MTRPGSLDSHKFTRHVHGDLAKGVCMAAASQLAMGGGVAAWLRIKRV